MGIYDAKVGDKLTPEQIRQAAGVSPRSDRVVIAEEVAKDEQNVNEAQPTFDEMDKKRDYRYPLTMSSDYPAKIIFRVKKVEGVDALEATGIKKVYNEVSSFVGSFTKDNDESVADGTVDKSTKSKIISDSNIKKKELVSYENNTGGEDLGKVTLPLMSPLRYSDVASYNKTNLGVLGAAAESAALGKNPFAGASLANGQLTKAAGNLAGQAVAKNIGSIIGAAAGALGGGVVAGGLGAIAGSNIGEGLGAAASSATRTASAPNTRTLFENVQMREFSFDFKMIASNEREANEVKNIVKMFRQELYPEKIPLGTSGMPLAYKFPNIFEIEVKNRFQNNPGFKIQRCYLTNVQTTFNEVAKGMFVDGNFIETSISLTFAEIVALDKQKVRMGY
jgi:hypothetical protein